MVAIPQSGLLAQISSLRLRSGHSGQILNLSDGACASLPSPRLLVTGICAAPPLGEPVWARNLWVLIVCLFFLPVMLPSVLPRLAQLCTALAGQAACGHTQLPALPSGPLVVQNVALGSVTSVSCRADGSDHIFRVKLAGLVTCWA